MMCKTKEKIDPQMKNENVKILIQIKIESREKFQHYTHSEI